VLDNQTNDAEAQPYNEDEGSTFLSIFFISWTLVSLLDEICICPILVQRRAVVHLC